jgi:hypothetical protein
LDVRRELEMAQEEFDRARDAAPALKDSDRQALARLREARVRRQQSIGRKLKRLLIG